MGRDAAEVAEPTPTPAPISVEIPPMPLSVDPSREPTAPRRRLGLAAAALVLFAGGAVAAARLPGAVPSAEALRPEIVASFAPQVHEAVLAPQAAPEPPVASAVAPEPPAPAPPPAPLPPRADAHIARTGHGWFPGGVVFMPTTFASADGAYDLYLHFHGNTAVVRESVEHAGINAVVAVVNLGVNSAPYTDAYAVPTSYEKLLAGIDRAVGDRGLEHPHVRRVAIGSWSAGYGAISRILEHGRGIDSLDAILVLDGIHCGYVDDDPRALNTRIISPFLDATRRAAEGKILFSITHSEIDPPTYAGTDRTASYLLETVHGQRAEAGEAPEHVPLEAAVGAVSKKLEKRMEPTTEATVGTFHVRGFKGNTPEHHMAHLLQMAGTVMPELAQRWKAAP